MIVCANITLSNLHRNQINKIINKITEVIKYDIRALLAALQ